MISFALDPAIGSSGACGVALAVDGVITHAGIIRKPKGLGNDLAAQWEVAHMAVSWMHGVTGLFLVSNGDQFITEWPEVYVGSNKNPNQALLPMCGVVGAVSGMLPPNVKRVQFLPKQWKNNLNADAFTQRILSRLSPQELAVVNAIEPEGLRHNAIDACGLLAFHFGRLTPRRATPSRF